MALCGVAVSETHTDGEYRITLTGVELKGLVGKRIVYPPADNAYLTFNSSPEYIIAQLIQTQLIAPADTKRTLPLMSIAAFDESSTKIRKEYRFSDIQEEIVELAETYARELAWIISIHAPAQGATAKPAYILTYILLFLHKLYLSLVFFFSATFKFMQKQASVSVRMQLCFHERLYLAHHTISTSSG